MLENLYVKNFILIEEADIDFSEHFNILTGETGAGKSILIGSMNLALGGRMTKEMVRHGTKEALVELVFKEDRPEILEKLAEFDICPEDGKIIISRKCTEAGRTTTKVNGSSITLSALRAASSLLLDIHGQHENQSLLDKTKHLEILDRFAGEEEHQIHKHLEFVYHKYENVCLKIKELEIPEEQRLREKSFLEYEMSEIENAGIKEGEEEELEAVYKKAKNASRIAEGLGMVLALLEDGGMGQDNTASELLLQSIRSIHSIEQLDSGILELSGQLKELEGLFGQFTADARHYLEGISYDQEELMRVEGRLDKIHSIQSRYGSTVEQIQAYYEKISKKYKQYSEYEETIKTLTGQKKALEEEMEVLSARLSEARHVTAQRLTGKIIDALKDLNFLDVQFMIEFRRLPHFTKHGYDEVEFMISTNPGQECRPLSKIASGGELSRIMLAIKSVMADKDQVCTLIFDEIDSGISGRTAQRVSEKLSAIAREHQVLCITHLPQIAAMADCHFCIEKSTDGMVTTTTITGMDEQASVKELARMLGGAKITQAVLRSAKEMRLLAEKQKFKNAKGVLVKGHAV